jgi:hypothetical protein
MSNAWWIDSPENHITEPKSDLSETTSAQGSLHFGIAIVVKIWKSESQVRKILIHSCWDGFPYQASSVRECEGVVRLL